MAVADLKSRSGTYRGGYSKLQRRRSVNNTLPQQQGKDTRQCAADERKGKLGVD